MVYRYPHPEYFRDWEKPDFSKVKKNSDFVGGRENWRSGRTLFEKKRSRVCCVL